MERRSWVSSGVVERRSNYSIFAGPRSCTGEINITRKCTHVTFVSRTLPPSAIRLVRLQAPEGAQDMAFYTAAAAAKAARVHDLKAHVV